RPVRGSVVVPGAPRLGTASRANAKDAKTTTRRAACASMTHPPEQIPEMVIKTDLNVASQAAEVKRRKCERTVVRTKTTRIVQRRAFTQIPIHSGDDAKNQVSRRSSRPPPNY